MNCRLVFRLMFILGLMVLISSPALSLRAGAEDGEVDPVISSNLELERISAIDSNPAIMRLTIPWEGGEPIIINISYRISGGEWVDIPEWEEGLLVDQTLSIIDFPVGLDWGVHEIVYIKVSDAMGTSSSVGCQVILSRSPTVNIEVFPSENSGSLPGEYTFEASISDPDRQDLACLWKVNGMPISSEEILKTYLDVGSHNICVEATDGQWSISDEVVIDIRAADVDDPKDRIDILSILSLSFLILTSLSVLSFTGYAVYTKYRSKWFERSVTTNSLDLVSGKGTLVCDICLKEMKEDRPMVNCRCGSRFHKGCGRREGVCPECGREILI